MSNEAINIILKANNDQVKAKGKETTKFMKDMNRDVKMASAERVRSEKAAYRAEVKAAKDAASARARVAKRLSDQQKKDAAARVAGMKAVAISLFALVHLGRRLTGIFSRVITHFDAIGKSARSIGFTTVTFQKMAFAARRNNMETGRFSQALQKMQRTIDDSGDGMKTAIGSMAKLGLTFDDLAGKTPEEQFKKMTQGLLAIEDASTRVAVANEVWGRAGRMVLNMARDYEQVAARLNDIGGVISAEDVQSAEDAKDALEEIKTVLTAKIGSTFIHSINQALRDTLELLVAIEKRDMARIFGATLKKGSTARTATKGGADVAGWLTGWTPLAKIMGKLTGNKELAESMAPSALIENMLKLPDQLYAAISKDRGISSDEVDRARKRREEEEASRKRAKELRSAAEVSKEKPFSDAAVMSQDQALRVGRFMTKVPGTGDEPKSPVNAIDGMREELSGKLTIIAGILEKVTKQSIDMINTPIVSNQPARIEALRAGFGRAAGDWRRGEELTDPMIGLPSAYRNAEGYKLPILSQPTSPAGIVADEVNRNMANMKQIVSLSKRQLDMESQFSAYVNVGSIKEEYPIGQ